MSRLFALLVLTLASLLPLAPAQTFLNPRHIVTPADPSTVLTLDLNGDGRPDIVYGTGLYYSAALHLLLANPDGSFRPGDDIPLPIGVSARCLTADFNQDHLPDLICAGSEYSAAPFALAAVLLGQGNGHLSAPTLLLDPAHPFGSTQLSSVAAIADLNQDGLPDVVITPIQGDTLYTLLGDGTGHFTIRHQLAGTVALQATLADLNGDGHLDLVTASLGGSLPMRFLGNGDGTFAPPVPLPFGGNSPTGGLVLADLDGDGRPDLVGGSPGVLAVYHGRPDGSFDPQPFFTRDSTAGYTNSKVGFSDYLYPLLVADLNGDGRPDLLAASSDGLAVSLGTPGALFGPPTHYSVDQNFFPGGVFVGINFADLDGDGHLDLLTTGVNGIWVNSGRADGSFTSAAVYPSGLYAGAATIADFNEDGNPDVVTSGDTTLQLSLGHANGTFAPAASIPGAVKYTLTDSSGLLNLALVHGDFDGDHHQDLLTTGYPAVYTTNSLLLRGHGDGTFTQPAVIPALGSYSFQQDAVGDLNRDGRDDLISLETGNQPTSLTALAWLSDGAGGFRQVRSPLTSVAPSSAPLLYSVEVSRPYLADLDHDGILDLVAITTIASDPLTPTLLTAQGVGDGTFHNVAQFPIQTGWPGNQFGSTLAVGDFDGDGQVDIAVLAGAAAPSLSATPQNRALLYFGTGHPAASGSQFGAPLPGPVVAHQMSNIFAADLDRDGRSDLLIDDDDDFATLIGGEFIAVFHANQDRTFGPEADLVAGPQLNLLQLADLNHDGRPDILTANGEFNAAANSFTVLLNLPGLSSVSTTPTDLTLTATPNPATVNQPVHLSFSATNDPADPANAPQPTGTLTLAEASTTLSSATIASGQGAAFSTDYPFSTPGDHTLTLTYSGDATHSAATITTVVHVLAPAPATVPTATTLTTSPTSLYLGQSLTLQASVSPAATGSVHFFADGQPLGTVTLPPTGPATLSTTSLPSGSHILTATFAGSGLFLSSASSPVTVTVAPATFSLSLSPASLTVRGGTTATVQVVAAALGTFTSPLALAAGQVPATSTVSFSPGNLSLSSTPSAQSTLRITTSPLPAYTVAKSAILPRCTPPLLLACTLTGVLLLLARRRRSLPSLLVALLAVSALASLSGCGYLAIPATPSTPTTYTIPVSATDPATGATTTAQLTLTITP